MVSLGACKLFDGLSATELNTLRGLCRVETFPAGHEIFREGEPGEAVYVIRAGSVEILAQISADKREVMSRLGPGEFFGEMSVIEFRPRSATAVAATQVTVYRIPAGEMLTFIHHTPDIAVNFTTRLIWLGAPWDAYDGHQDDDDPDNGEVFDPWFLAGGSRGRSESGLMFTWQF